MVDGDHAILDRLIHNAHHINLCRFRRKLDSKSDRKWTLNPKESGRPIQWKVDTESDPNWTLVSPVSD